MFIYAILLPYSAMIKFIVFIMGVRVFYKMRHKRYVVCTMAVYPYNYLHCIRLHSA